MKYPVNADGTLGAGTVLLDATADVKAKKPGLPDGLKVDTKGNLWATGPGGVFDDRARRHAPGHDLDRRAHCQRRVGR